MCNRVNWMILVQLNPKYHMISYNQLLTFLTGKCIYDNKWLKLHM